MEENPNTFASAPFSNPPASESDRKAATLAVRQTDGNRLVTIGEPEAGRDTGYRGIVVRGDAYGCNFLAFVTFAMGCSHGQAVALYIGRLRAAAIASKTSA